MTAIVILIYILSFMLAVTVHEYAHGRVAYFFGDMTAKRSGRLSFNPLRHIDPFWTVLFPIMMFMLFRMPIGMAKPVPVNFMNLRNPKRDMIWVAAAGPCANILCAAALSLIIHRWHLGVLLLPLYLNVGLAVFNLVPILPLDGGRIVMGIIPRAWAIRYVQFERYGFLIILVLVYTGGVGKVILPIINGICFLLQVPGLG